MKLLVCTGSTWEMTPPPRPAGNVWYDDMMGLVMNVFSPEMLSPVKKPPVLNY